ncbi:MAG: hypothetical protein Kow0063_36140 [Anaerolineae bacterium]
MQRGEAIQRIAEHMLSRLTPEEAIEAIRAFFNDFIPDDLRPQLDPALVAQHDRHDVPPTIIPSDPRYGPVLLHQMKRRMRGVTNAYLSAYMYGEMNMSVDVEGEMTPLLACPVCGYHSLPIRGNWDVCQVCGWVSDPVQEAVPDEGVGANNVSLNQARQNFARTGFSSGQAGERVHPHGKYMYPRAKGGE